MAKTKRKSNPGDIYKIYGIDMLILNHVGKGFYNVKNLGRHGVGFDIRGKWTVLNPGNAVEMHSNCFSWGHKIKPKLSTVLRICTHNSLT